MSFPFGAGDAKPGDYGASAGGSIPGMTGRTQDAVTENLKSTVGDGNWGGLGGGLVGMILSIIAGVVGAILGTFATVVDAILGTVDNGYLSGMPVIQEQAGSITATRSVAVTTTVIDGQTVTRYVYTGNGTWTKPTPGTGQKIVRIGAAVISGGNGGNGPPGNPGDGQEGGEGGGYSYREWASADVPSSVTITVGAGGVGGGVNTLGQVGGTSSFGSLLSGVAGTSSIATSQGAVASTSAPGRGGNGGGGGHSDGSGSGAYFYASPGQRGQSTALGTGGDGGTAQGTGFAAGTTGTDSQIISGGGGGGGGGGSPAVDGGIGTALRPGGGGAGSAPGGGGGGAGGGYRGGLGVGDWLPGGGAGNGCVAIWVYMEGI